jgi:hypothetical protein
MALEERMLLHVVRQPKEYPAINRPLSLEYKKHGSELGII